MSNIANRKRVLVTTGTTVRHADITDISPLPAMPWSEWNHGWAGLVHTLVDAKWFELALLMAGYNYTGSQTFGREHAKYWQITYQGPQGKIFHIRYQPQKGERKPEWQLGWFVDGVWVNYGDPVAEWPVPRSTLRRRAREQLPAGAVLSERPVLLHLPVDLAALAEGHHAEWDPADGQITTTSQADDDALIATLVAIGFERRERGVFRDQNSGQQLTVVQHFDIGADGVTFRQS